MTLRGVIVFKTVWRIFFASVQDVRNEKSCPGCSEMPEQPVTETQYFGIQTLQLDHLLYVTKIKKHLQRQDDVLGRLFSLCQEFDSK